jgi:hypothetical protein
LSRYITCETDEISLLAPALTPFLAPSLADADADVDALAEDNNLLVEILISKKAEECEKTKQCAGGKATTFKTRQELDSRIVGTHLTPNSTRRMARPASLNP